MQTKFCGNLVIHMNLLLMIYQNICVSHTMISKRPCPLTIKFEIIILIISIVKVYFC